MNLKPRSFFIGVLLGLMSVSACAEDTVAIRYVDGYPLPGRSSESVNLRVSRTSPSPIATETSKQEVDRFFEQVSAVLRENKITKDWQLAIPDAPAIEITIDIDGQKLKLLSCHTALERRGNYLVTEQGGQVIPDKDRASVLARQSEIFRRHRTAFEKILSSTLEIARVRLAP